MSIWLFTVPSTLCYSLTLRPGINCHKSFPFILWVWYGVIKRRVKYFFIHPCLYQKFRKERAMSFKESRSECISWWKWRFFSRDYSARGFCTSHTKPMTPLWGKRKKKKKFQPAPSLTSPFLHPCRRLTLKFLQRKTKGWTGIFSSPAPTT